MANKRTNLSDRKVIDTQGGAIRDPDFRTPEVPLVGRDVPVITGGTGGGTTSPTDPSNPARSTEVGVPRDIRMEENKVVVRSDGSAVVDVILSYIPADGAARHEMRISKVSS